MTDVNKSTLTREPDGTLKLLVTIPVADIQKTREEVIEETVKNAEITGFRKGKAPRNLVEERLDATKVQEEILKKLLPPSYVKAVEENNLKPIMNPKIHIQKIEKDKDWVFEATTCEMPEVKLGDYKERIKKVTAKSKIILPGKEDQKQAPKFEEIVQALLEGVETQIPSVLSQQEADRLLSQTLDEIKRLGLTLDQYLASTGKNPEMLRKDYEEKAKNDMKMEFVLQKVAEEEKITVDQPEIEEAIQKAKDPKERENLERNRYLLASILRQQKTLDFLKNLW